jgi:hypothetical protein
MIWICGKELLEPPYNLTKSRLWELVEAGSLIPCDATGWRVIPGNNQADYDRLQSLYYDLKVEKEKATLTEKIELLESALRPDKIWKGLDALPEQQAKLLSRLLASYYRDTEIRAISATTAQADVGPVAKEGFEHAEKEPGRKTVQLRAGGKKRLEEIIPAVKAYYQALNAEMKREHRTAMTNLKGDAWRDKAVRMCGESGTWNEVIELEDVQKIDFEQHAVSEHKERFRHELAQIVLAREGFGTVSRTKIKDFF